MTPYERAKAIDPDMSERLVNRIAAAIEDHCSDQTAAHDRAVAARVLRDACRFLRWDSEIIMLKQLAAQYERGEREVPSE